MAQSLVQNHIHIVFCTKHRQPLITENIESELHSYIAGICSNLECYPTIVGGYTDHIHILCKLSPKIALMKLLQEIKSNSSKWIKTKGESFHNFYWQDGYGVFSVGYEGVENVERYIRNQKNHHAKNTFQSEYRILLLSNHVEYDEQYVWD